MRRFLAAGVLTVLGLLGSTNTASAQSLDFRPIDTNRFVVQPADTATNIFSGTSRYLSRVVAGTIEDNGFVRTINSLLGRRADAPATRQPGYSPLPSPSLYPSTSYKNSFTPSLPRTQIFGRTPGG